MPQISLWQLRRAGDATRARTAVIEQSAYHYGQNNGKGTIQISLRNYSGNIKLVEDGSRRFQQSQFG
jgi:hypothetical protein